MDFRFSVLIILFSLVNCEVILHTNDTFISAYLPYGRYNSDIYVEATGILLPADKAMPGSIVFISSPLLFDIEVARAEAAGAVGAIVFSGSAVPGGEFTYSSVSVWYSIPTVSIAVGDIKTIASTAGKVVTINNSDGNVWFTVFGDAQRKSIQIVIVTLFAIIYTVGIMTITLNLREQKRFVLANACILTTAALLSVIGRVDINGAFRIYGYSVATVMTYIGVQIIYGELWIYNSLLKGMTKSNTNVNKLLDKVWLFIVIGSVATTVDLVLALVGIYARVDSRSLAYARIALATTNLACITIVYLTFGSKVLKALAESNSKSTTKKRIASWIIVNGAVSGVRTIYAPLSLLMFAAPCTVYAHYWIESLLGVAAIGCLITPIAINSLLRMNKTHSIGRSTKSTQMINMTQASV